jgi:glycosyltransferase involved in cell wall biosynthesis
MRIAFVLNAITTVSANVGYGGIERVVYQWLLELIKRGHTVTVFTVTGSSVEGAEIISLSEPRMNRDYQDYVDITAEQARKAFEMIAERGDYFDVIHDQTGMGGRYASLLNIPVVVTLHNGVSQSLEFAAGYTDNVSYVAISQSERNLLEEAGIPVSAVVYNEINCEYLLNLELAETENVLLWMGRMVPEKGFDLAAEVASLTGCTLRAAGPNFEEQHRLWYDSQVLPRLGHVEQLGIINDSQKPTFFAGAKALLMPNRCFPNQWCDIWREPFGLIGIESMAAGVPVISTRSGALVELLDNFGGICVQSTSDEETVAEMVHALSFVDMITPEACRRRARDFGPGTSVQGYLNVYNSVLA